MDIRGDLCEVHKLMQIRPWDYPPNYDALRAATGGLDDPVITRHISGHPVDGQERLEG